MSNHDEHGVGCGCAGSKAATLYAQDLSEVDFLRSLAGACAYGKVDKARQLLAAGTDPNETDASGMTPLHYAAGNGHVELCKLLLAAGADPSLRTRSLKMTALDRAKMRGHSDVVELLLLQAPKVVVAQDSPN